MASQVTIEYATSAGHAGNAGAIVADGVQIQASQLQAVVATYVSESTLSSTISEAISPISGQINSVESDLTAHQGNKNNPHSVTKAQVGLGNVDNTADLNKPVSVAQQAAIDSAKSTIDDYTVNYYDCEVKIESMTTNSICWFILK